jgi:putative tryptophan/tyrosine transport system substrate-binding protein
MPLLQLTRTLPIVFVQVADAVGAGLIENLGRPGGNATGFLAFEYATSAKWLELLKEIAHFYMWRDPGVFARPT